MPTSKGRKAKRRAKKSARARRNHDRPPWFDEAIHEVIDQRWTLLAACGPRELEQATAELLGAQLHRIAHSEDQSPYFPWWFAELLAQVVTYVSDPMPPDGPVDPSMWRLLHGVIAVGPTEFCGEPLHELLDATTGRSEFDWLPLTCRVQATGEVWRMADDYGTHVGLIAGFEFPGGVDRHVYLFDVDVCGPVDLIGANVFDTVEDAAQAWRSAVGAAAMDSHPKPVTDSAQLRCLSYCRDLFDLAEPESRNRLDNWFRAPRRVEELIVTLRRRGKPLPPATPPFDDGPLYVPIDSFIDWYEERHGAAPDKDAAAELVWHWLELALPGTWELISPHRVIFQMAMTSYWPDDPTANAARDLLPAWVQFLGERAGLTEPAFTAVVAPLRL